MPQKIQVGGQATGWHTFARIAAPTVAVGGIGLLLFGGPPELGVVLVVLGIVLSIGVEIDAATKRWQRRWAMDLGDGVEITDRQRVRRFRDEQVASVALEIRKNFSGGVLKSRTRVFRFWVENDPTPITLTNVIPQTETDPLLALIDRMIESVSRRENDALDRGGLVVGEGWRLDRASITVGRAPREEQIPFSEVTAIEVFEGKMCLWRTGRDEAVARFPLGSRNAYLLPQLALPRLPVQAESLGDGSTAGLGRILFERKTSKSAIVLLYLGMGTALILGLVLLLQMKRDPTAGLFGAGLLVVALGCLLGALALRYSVFRCHERGVYQANVLGEKRLRYDQVATFTYSAVKHYHNGAYVGTHLSLKFEPVPGGDAKKIAYGAQVHSDDDDLDELRDFISRTLASRMFNVLKDGNPVAWTPNLTFSPEGIQYLPAGFFGRKPPVFMPFDQYGGHSLDQGVFYLFQHGQPKAVTSEQVSAANFFPGFYLLLMLKHQG